MGDAVGVTLRTGPPVAPMQRPLWISQRRHPDAPVQNMALLSHIDGAIDSGRFVEAFRHVVAASDALRTTILDVGAAPTIEVSDEVIDTEVVDVPRADADEWARRRARLPLTVRRCGYDSALLRHEDGTSSWYLCLHHTITDATSSALVFTATAHAYEGEPVELDSYYDWVAGLDTEGSPRRSRALAHWRDRPTAPGVGRFYRTNRDAAPAAERRELPLDGESMVAIEAALAGPYRMISDELAWSTLLITATAVHLHRVARAERFSVGLPVHNRGDDRSRALIGPTMEVFPVDIEVEPGDTFRTLHGRVARSVMQTLRHAQPGTAPTADYEAVVNVILRADLGSFGAIAATTRWIHVGAIDASHLLRVQLTSYGGATGLALDLNESTADAVHRARAPGHLTAILNAMVDDPDRSVLDGSLCLAEEEAALETWGTGPAWSTDAVGVVHRLRAGLSGRSSVALEDGSRTWTGDELWSEVAGIARTLADRGIGPGERVAVSMPRSADAVIAILATLVAGGSYVPLDPAQPEARRARLAQRACCRVVLTELPDPTPGPEPDHEPSLSDEAYLLFTSGSTGEPKGVPITHLGLARYLEFAESSYVDPDTPLVVALFTALTFDLTVTSLFLPLIAGGRSVVITEEGPAGLTALADRREVTWCKATPSHLKVLARLLPDDHRLATVVVGGEAFGAHLARRLLDLRPGLAIFNEYGPTEAVVGCMIHRTGLEELVGATEVPIGRPAPGVTLRVLDDALERVVIGAPGELCIAHDGLTGGYLLADGDRAGPATHEPFVEIEGRRFYRSGDLVRMTDDHTLEYLGRIDAQVKVGGIRLEPSEVENALLEHPAVHAAAVRLWTPRADGDVVHCVRCGLPSNVPGASYDDRGVCSSCISYDEVAPQAESWFRTPDDLREVRDRARAAATGDHDCLHLLSGGKDSTYALYQLVEMGFRPYALTLDNGFISEGAKDNVRRSVEYLGIDHEFATADAMNEIFRDSLERHSNVCNGCYKTIYTIATTRAAELGIPLIVTGLSRGQLFETRLIPQQFREGRFDPDAIDRAVLEARRAYHRVDDAARRLLDSSIFDSDDWLDHVEFLDFYRYVDVPLSEMLAYLGSEAPWVRPADTGRSTNCLINVAGIKTHLTEQGYHNYAVPYAWDVRLGHKTRQEAMDELDDEIDLAEVERILREVDYEPTSRQVLTAWIETRAAATTPGPAELRAFLSDRLPGHAVPAAFVVVPALPFTTNGKLDDDALPAPTRVHRSGPALEVAPESPLERTLVSVWERVLRIEPIGVEDDFFALGGDSLSALEMIVAVGDELGLAIREDLAFSHATPRSLAEAIAPLIDDATGPAPDAADTAAAETDGGRAWPAPAAVPPLSDGETAILYEQSMRDRTAGGNDVRYNTARVHRVHAEVAGEAVAEALRSIAARHVPLSWGYGTPRRHLTPDEAVEVEVGVEAMPITELEAGSARRHRRPFDLENGPLLRAWVQPVDDGTTQILLAMHHVSGDALSFDRLWEQLDAALHGRPEVELPVDYATFTEWQRTTRRDEELAYWTPPSAGPPPARFAIHRPPVAEPDGYVDRTVSVSPEELRHGTDVGGFAAALTAITAVLRAYADGDRVATGFVASTRTHPDAAALSGYFLNTLPIELDTSPSTSLRDLAAQAREVSGRHLANRTLPYAEIVAARREAGATPPDLDVLMSFEELGDVSFGGAHVDHRVLFNGTAVADATFFIQPRSDRVDVGVEYRGSTVPAAVARRLLADVDVALRTLVDAPDTNVGELPLPSRTHAIRHGVDLAPPLPVVDSIRGNFDARPTEPAVVCGEETLEWGDLGRRSARVAASLAARGIGPGDRVVLALPRSVDLVATIVGVLRLGAAYVPVDPGHPAARIALIAREAGAAASVTDDPDLVLTDNDVALADVLAPDNAISTVFDAELGPDHEAYVIFTSGSTGTPRGVAVRHGELAHSTAARSVHYPETPARFLVVSSPAFDSSVAGIFWTLTTGGTVVLPTDREVHDVNALLGMVGDGSTTHTLLVPTLYQVLLEHSKGGPWPERVIVAGEACSPGVVALHHERQPGSTLTNEYGPTEATVWVTAADLEPDAPFVSIGEPIPDAWVAVVDEHMAVRPDGVEGELIVGGPTVTGGYVNDEDATRERFGGAPGLPGRFFRTGDRAVMIDGEVRFLGRHDHQLNVGGVRAEPEEIERVLTAVPGVVAAVVVVADPRSLDELVDLVDGDAFRAALASATAAPDPRAALADALRAAAPHIGSLVAHVEAVGPVDLDALRARAARELPALLRPQIYVVHEALPRSPHGKIDRAAAAALPALAPAVSAPVAPTTADGLEQQIAEIMAGVLRSGPVAHDASFFEVGGHSLLAMELLVRLEEHLGVELDVAALYEVATPRAMAAVIRGSEGSQSPTGANFGVGVGAGERGRFVVPIQPRGSRPPIVAVHVLGSNEEFYRPLAEHLGADQPLFGLTVPVDNPDPALTEDVDVIVGAYLAELDERFPEGPIGLLGMSLGGPISFELARRLRAGGREITMVGMLDAGGPDAHRYRLDRAGRLALQARRAREAGVAEVVSDWAEFQRVRLNRYFERVMLRLVSLTGRTPSVRLRMRRIVENNVKAVRRFALVPDDLAVTVFKGLDDPHSERLVANAMGWGRVARRGVEIVPVPGDHLTMVAEPHVAALAAAVEQVVAEAAGSPAGLPAAPGPVDPETRDREPLDRETLAGTLCRSLADDRLVGDVADLIDGASGSGLDTRLDARLDAGARELLAEVDETLATMAEWMRAESSRVIEHLAGTSIPARPAPIPDRMLRATFGLTVAPTDVDAAIAALDDVGYRLQRPLGPAGWRAHRRLDGGVVLIATDEVSTRLHLVWDPHRAAAERSAVGRLVQPRAHDLAVRLPERLWPLYWLVRPLRLLRDRVTNRPGGGDLGPFLATPQAMLVPLMHVADVGPHDLLVDVGCGDGRVVVDAARRFGCRARGVERDPALAAMARKAVADAGLADRVEIVEGDVDIASLRDATVVFSFLPPGATAGILELCLEHLGPGARVLTHEQLDTEWPREPDRSELVLGQGVTVARLWRVS